MPFKAFKHFLEQPFTNGWVIFTTLIVVTQITIFSRSNYDKDTDYSNHIQSEHQIFSFPIPNQLTFSGEKVPLDDIEVYERFDRELLVNAYWQSQTILFIKRAHRFFPIIEPILKKNGIPDDFKYLCVAESGLSNVVSSVGASGYWQFMPATAPSYGLTVNDGVDERYDIERSTEAACKYLKEAHLKFGSWSNAAASYNMGMGGVSKEIATQGASNYYDLYLNAETSRYLLRIVSLKEIMQHPEKYGFHVRVEDKYPTIPMKKINVNSKPINWVNVAKDNGITYKTLRYCNPWIRKATFENTTQKTYSVSIPKTISLKELIK